MIETHFRRLELDDLDNAHALVSDVTTWLLAKGVDQWREPVPLDVYRERQGNGHNFGLFVKGELAGVVSLSPYRPRHWEQALPSVDFTWLGTLATAPRFKGRDLGRVILREAEKHLASEGVSVIYLDYVHGRGVLPAFYASAGYEEVLRLNLSLDDGTTFESVLMRKLLLVAPSFDEARSQQEMGSLRPLTRQG
jgi:GNAT superfamily N-acetyltransferase